MDRLLNGKKNINYEELVPKEIAREVEVIEPEVISEPETGEALIPKTIPKTYSSQTNNSQTTDFKFRLSDLKCYLSLCWDLEFWWLLAKAGFLVILVGLKYFFKNILWGVIKVVFRGLKAATVNTFLVASVIGIVIAIIMIIATLMALREAGRSSGSEI